MRLEPTVRVACAADAENLAALHIQVWVHTYATEGISSPISRFVLTAFNVNALEALVADPNAFVVVAESNNGLIGCAVVKFGSSTASTRSTSEVATLYVQEHFMCRGVGTALLRAAQAEARRRTSSSCVWLSVNARNASAIAFYRGLGLVHHGVSHFELGGERHENQVLVSGDA